MSGTPSSLKKLPQGSGGKASEAEKQKGQGATPPSPKTGDVQPSSKSPADKQKTDTAQQGKQAGKKKKKQQQQQPASSARQSFENIDRYEVKEAKEAEMAEDQKVLDTYDQIEPSEGAQQMKEGYTIVESALPGRPDDKTGWDSDREVP